MLYQAKVDTVNPLSLNIWNDTKKSVSLGKIPDNAIVNVMQEYNSTWAVCEYKGKSGYVDRQYLVKIAPVEPPKPIDPAIVAELERKAAELIAIANELRVIAGKLRA